MIEELIRLACVLYLIYVSYSFGYRAGKHSAYEEVQTELEKTIKQLKDEELKNEQQ